MKKIIITDVTLRKGNESGEKLSFKERTETAKLLDKLGTDVIDVGGIADRTDLLFLHTISPVIKKSIISCNAGLTEASADEAYKAVSECENKRLYISVPASTTAFLSVSLRSVKSTPPISKPIGGIITSFTKLVTILLKAEPITTPTAISITFPFEINSLNSFNIFFIFPP